MGSDGAAAKVAVAGGVDALHLTGRGHESAALDEVSLRDDRAVEMHRCAIKGEISRRQIVCTLRQKLRELGGSGPANYLEHDLF